MRLNKSIDSSIKVPEGIKAEVRAKIEEFIKTVLKPHYRDKRANQIEGWPWTITDISARWQENFLHIYLRCRNNEPAQANQAFEIPFARLEHLKQNRFNLAVGAEGSENVDNWANDVPLDDCLWEISVDDYWWP